MTARHPKRKPRADKSLAAFLLMLGGCYLLATAPNNFRGQLSAVLVMLTGGAMVASGGYIAVKDDLNADDYLAGFGVVADSLTSTTATATKQLRRIPLQQLPPPLKTGLQTLFDSVLADEDWMRRLCSKSHMVAGASHSGKTVFLHWEVIEFIQRHPKGLVRVFDPNFGKRGNTWFGLPRAPIETHKRTGQEIIFTETLDLPELINEAWQEMETRRKATIEGTQIALTPHLLVCCEFNTEMKGAKSKLSKEQYEKLETQYDDLIYRGHGYKVFLTVEVQTLAVGKTGVDEATCRQLNAVLLGDTALEAKEVAKIAPGKSEDLMARIKQLRRVPGGKYACLLKLEGEAVQVQIVPEIDVSATIIDVPEPGDTPAQAWAKSLDWTKIRGESLSKTKAWQTYGQGKGRQGLENPYYKAFLELFNTEGEGDV